MRLKDITAKKKKEQRKKRLTQLLTIIVLIVMPCVLIIASYLFYYKIITSFILNIHQQDAVFVKNFRTKFLSKALVNIDKSEIKKFAGLNQGSFFPFAPLEEELNMFWNSYQEELLRLTDATHQTQFMMDKQRLDWLNTLKQIAFALPDEKPGWWTSERWSEDKYQSALTSEIKFVESWKQTELEIRIEPDLRKRMQIILSALQSNPYVKSRQYAAKRYLAGMVINSIIEQDNRATEEVLTSIMPEVRDYHGISLPLAVIHKRIQESASDLAAYNSFQYIRDGLDHVVKQSEDRAFMMEKVLDEILADLSDSEKNEILQYILRLLKENYLFDLSDKALLSEVQPRTKILEKHLKNNDPSRQMIQTLCHNTLYLSELQAISGLISVKYYQYEVISTFKRIVDRIELHMEVEPSDVDDLEQKLSEFLSSKTSYAENNRNYFLNEKQHLSVMKILLKRWKHDDTPAERDKVEKQIKDFLIKQCKTAKYDCGL